MAEPAYIDLTDLVTTDESDKSSYKSESSALPSPTTKTLTLGTALAEFPWWPHNEIDIAAIVRDLEVLRAADQNVLIDDAIEVEYNLTTKAHKGNLHVKHAYHVSLMPEYPQTSKDGVLYVISTAGLSKEEIDKWHSTIQYSKEKRNHRQVKSSYLGDVLTTLRTYRCSGVKTCECLHQSLQEHHTEVDPSWATKITSVKESEAESATQWPDTEKTQNYFRFLKNTFHCLPFGSCNGKLTIKQTMTKTSAMTYRAYCSAYKPNDGVAHFIKGISPQEGLNFEYLAHLCVNEDIQRRRECTTIRNMNSSLPRCDVLHYNGRGILVHQKCSVTFTMLTPVDLQETPFVLLHCIGVHEHPPPPPTRIPTDIQKDIETLIRQGDVLNMTRGAFLRSQPLQNYLSSLNLSHPSEIHPSFTNQDKWSALIQKQKLLLHPFGTDLGAVIYEYQRQKASAATDPQNVPYIRAISNEADTGLILVCVSDSQAERFFGLRFWEVDMTFKRIHGDIHEVVFSTYLGDSEGNSVVCLARVYVSKNTARMYEKVFTMLFESIANANRRVLWKHIHGTGFEAVTADMCPKQAEGLGKHLAGIDSTRSWREHIQHALAFCLVHYSRNIRRYHKHSQYGTMKELPFMSSQKRVMDFLQQWKRDPQIGGWIRHKMSIWILSGINPIFSKIPAATYAQIQRHTNNGEAGHAHINRTGVHQTLLGGILSARRHDDGILQRMQQFKETNVPTSSRSKNGLSRLQRAEVRRASRFASRQSDNDEEGSPTPKARKRPRSSTAANLEITEAKERAEIKALELSQREKELELRERELTIRERELALSAPQAPSIPLAVSQAPADASIASDGDFLELESLFTTF